MKILLIDNYDSFTYNLVHILREMDGVEVIVRRNDKFSQAEVLAADAILLSPGPGLPADAGGMPDLLKSLAGTKPILGVCLGLQAITEHYGGSLQNLDRVYHGLSSTVVRTDSDDPILKDLPERFEAGRYHSWVADRTDFPAELLVTAEIEGEDNAIMAIRHVSDPIFGLQFHPESVLTPLGTQMIANFVAFARQYSSTTSKQLS
jgi:anthranilate synthase component 2